MESSQNEWQREEVETQSKPKGYCPILKPPQKRPSFLSYLSVIGPKIELENVIEYLQAPLVTNQFELPAFRELNPLGFNCLIINLEDQTCYMTEDGLQLGEWRRFYLPHQYPELVRELVEEAKRLKQN